MSRYFNINNLSVISFVVFCCQLTHTVVNWDFNINSILLLGLTGVFVVIAEVDVPRSIEKPINHEFEKHKQLVNSILEETTKLHDDISSKYADIIDRRVDDEVEEVKEVDVKTVEEVKEVDVKTVEEVKEVECDHVFKKVVLGYDDIVRKCEKCELELQR
jgi:hypothetical protein